MKTKAVLFILLSLLSMSCLAAALSSTAHLDDITLAPGHYAMLSLKKLYPSIKHRVTCKMQSSTYADTSSQVIIKASNTNPALQPNIYIDDIQTIADGVKPASYKVKGSTLEIIPAYDSTEFMIRNLDYDNTLLLSNCLATPY
jgi:hypothetical protein